MSNDKKYKPNVRIDGELADLLLKLGSNMNTSLTRLVNMLSYIGFESLERALKKIKEDTNEDYKAIIDEIIKLLRKKTGVDK